MLIPGIIFGGIDLLFFVLSAIFWKGKGAWLISGYNTASAAEKRRTDEKALCRFMAKLALFMGLAWSVVTAGLLLETMALFWVGFVLFLAVTVGGIIYGNTGNRFRKY